MEEFQYLHESMYKVNTPETILSKNPKCVMITSVNRKKATPIKRKM